MQIVVIIGFCGYWYLLFASKKASTKIWSSLNLFLSMLQVSSKGSLVRVAMMYFSWLDIKL